MTTSDQATGAKWVGRVYAGNVPCFEFVREFLSDFGLELPAYDYTRDQHLEALRRHIVEHAAPVDSARFGDVVIMRMFGDPVHIGVMVSADEAMHHTRAHGVIIERVTGSRLRGRIQGYWRPRI